MGNQKQKWTQEEESALFRGVKRYGAGKWKNILKDPDFAPFLTSRSNIDLKDKWRNLSVSNGQGTKDKSRTPKIKGIAPAPLVTLQNTIPAPQTDDPSQNADHVKNQNLPLYNAMVLDALSTIKDTNGSDINAIASFIEQNHKVPQNFRRALSTRLRRLVNQGKLEKVQNCYKIKKDAPLGTKSPLPKSPAPKQKDISPRQSSASSFLVFSETIKDAADTAAYRVADAESKSFLAAEAVKEVERISRLAEDTDSMLRLVTEICEQCTADKQPCLLINKFSSHNLMSKITIVLVDILMAGSRGEIVLLA